MFYFSFLELLDYVKKRSHLTTQVKYFADLKFPEIMFLKIN